MTNLIADVIHTAVPPERKNDAGWYVLWAADAIDPPRTAIWATSFEAAQDEWCAEHGHRIGMDDITRRDYDEDSPIIWEGLDNHGKFVIVDTEGISGVGPVTLTWQE